MKQLIGLGVALATPFKVDGTIDYDALLRLLKHTENNVDYWVVMGSTGEAITLSEEEQEDILKFVLANNPTNLPIVLGLGGSNTAALVNRLQRTDFRGVTAVLSSSPAYNKPTQAGIIAHFTKFADNSPIPIILYNVPSRTCSNIEAATTLTLAEHPNIIGIKEASGDLAQIADIINKTPPDFMCISGDDMQTPDIIELGGKGVTSVLANALPKQFNNLLSAVEKGNIFQSKELTKNLQKINDLMYLEGNPVGIKELLAQLGICNNYVRLPLLPATINLQLAIKKAFSPHYSP